MERSEIRTRIEERACVRCGRPIPRIWPSGQALKPGEYAQRRYCSAACALAPRVSAERSCRRCGKVIPRVTSAGRRIYPGRYAQQQYCSDACKRSPAEAEERFWSCVDKGGPLWNGTPCWLWMGHRNKGGYGTFRGYVHGKRRTFKAHRYAYTLCGHTIPDASTLDHLCRTRHCVNPSHLEPVSRAENNRRGQGPGGMLYTRCPNGHPRTPDNLVTLPSGDIRCRICYTEGLKRRHARRDARPPMVCRNCGASRPERAKGLCWSCYDHQRRTGATRPVAPSFDSIVT